MFITSINHYYSKLIKKRRYLFSLCLVMRHEKILEIIESLIESKKDFDDYTIKLVNRRLYLWW